jgi:hypothetical protein
MDSSSGDNDRSFLPNYDEWDPAGVPSPCVPVTLFTASSNRAALMMSPREWV